MFQQMHHTDQLGLVDKEKLDPLHDLRNRNSETIKMKSFNPSDYVSKALKTQPSFSPHHESLSQDS